MLASAGINHILTRRLGARVSGAESVWLTVLATGLNAVTPARAGAAARALYLRRRHGLPLASFTSTLYGSYLLLLLAGGLSGVVAGLLIEPVARPILVGGAAIALAALTMTMLPVVGRPDGGLLSRNLARFTSGWEELRRDRRVIAPVAAMVVLQLIAGIGALWASIRALGVDLSLAEVTVIAAAGTLSTLVALTPGGIGIYEATVAVVSAVVGNEPGIVVAGALLQRVVLLVLLLVFAPTASTRLSRLEAGQDGPETRRPS